MNRFFRYPVAVLAFAFSVLALPAAALAADPPEIAGFEADKVDELGAGTELSFRLEGTPRARATVSVAGVKRPIMLRETAAGIYEGSYTLKKSDKLASNPAVRATLKQGNLATTMRLAQPLMVAKAAPAKAPEIQRFAVEPSRIEAGTELVFTLQGTPSGKASFSIDNTAQGLSMREVKPGVYEGKYTVRRQDKFGAANITAALEANGQVARSKVSPVPAASSQVKAATPREGEKLSQPFTLSGTFDDSVDPRSVRIFLGKTEVTREATITTAGFTYTPKENLPAGNYRAEVVSRDYTGNTGRTAWNFVVQPPAAAQAPAVPAPAAQAGFPLEFTSPADQTAVGGGSIEVRGRTAPNVSLNVNVEATASVGGLFGVSQNVFTRTIKADSRGDFVFTFEPRVTVPGARYEVSVSGTHGGQEKSKKLTLVQQ